MTQGNYPPAGGIGIREFTPASAKMYIFAMLASSPPEAARALTPPKAGPSSSGNLTFICWDEDGVMIETETAQFLSYVSFASCLVL